MNLLVALKHIRCIVLVR